MKQVIFIISLFFFCFGCHHSKTEDELKKEIFQTEKAFERMTSERSIPEAFHFFADENAVIKRENDTLVIGKENIRIYYENKNLKNATVNWTPDFIEISKSGDIAYTYGKYTWSIKDADGNTEEFKGIFHTVWKKQKDGSWKYVWD